MTIAHEQEYELYHYGESLCSQMVRVALCEKQIPYKSHHMFLELTGENVSREFKKINPTALVPVLVHNGEPHYDSWEIIKYLDAQAPEQSPGLWPKDAEKQRLAQASIADNSLDHRLGLGDNFGSSVAGWGRVCGQLRSRRFRGHRIG